MRQRLTRARGEAAGGDRPPTRDDEPATAAGSNEYMDYIADMILELQVMAEKANATTLSGILELAYREARQQMERSPAA